MTSASWRLPTTSFLFPFKNELLSCMYLATALSPPRDDRNMTRFPQPRSSADLLSHINRFFFTPPFVDPLEEPPTTTNEPRYESLSYSTFRDSDYLWKEPVEAFEFFHNPIAAGSLAKVIRSDSFDKFQSEINTIVTDTWKNDKTKDRHDRWVAFDNPQLLTPQFNDFVFHALGQSFDSEGDEEEQEEGPYIYAVFLERDNHFSLALISNELIVHYEHQHTRTHVDFSEFVDKYNVVGLAISWWTGDCDKLSMSRSGDRTNSKEVAEVGKRFFKALKQRRARRSDVKFSSFQEIMEWYTDGLFCPMYLLDHFVEENKNLEPDTLMFGVLIYDDCRGSYSETEEMIERVNLLTGHNFTSHALLDNGWQQARIARTWLMFLYEALALWENTEASVQKLMMAAAHVPRAGPEVSDYFRQFTLFLMKEQVESGRSSADKLAPFVVAAFGPEAAEKLLNTPVQFGTVDIDKFQSPITNREKPKKVRDEILNAVKKWSGKFEECRNQLPFPVTEGALRFAEATNFF